MTSSIHEGIPLRGCAPELRWPLTVRKKIRNAMTSANAEIGSSARQCQRLMLAIQRTVTPAVQRIQDSQPRLIAKAGIAPIFESE